MTLHAAPGAVAAAQSALPPSTSGAAPGRRTSLTGLASTAAFGLVEDNRRAIDVILRVAAAHNWPKIAVISGDADSAASRNITAAVPW